MERQPVSRNCFLCGRENEIGLKMSWYNDRKNQQVIGTVNVPERFCGYPRIVHGGIVAALLDETSGRAVMLNGDFNNLMVTLKLEVTYRRPTPCGETLTVVGWVIRQSNRRAQVAGEIRLPDGTVTAASSAILVRAPYEFMAGWEQERPYWRVYED
ncbi:MAG: PaaI family thioesterase [Syntrophomonadaceae bacterium]|nr:PaaI family thioesterase [Syntrophomonadaceae bacterium]